MSSLASRLNSVESPHVTRSANDCASSTACLSSFSSMETDVNALTRRTGELEGSRVSTPLPSAFPPLPTPRPLIPGILTFPAFPAAASPHPSSPLSILPSLVELAARAQRCANVIVRNSFEGDPELNVLPALV